MQATRVTDKCLDLVFISNQTENKKYGSLSKVKQIRIRKSADSVLWAALLGQIRATTRQNILLCTFSLI